MESAQLKQPQNPCESAKSMYLSKLLFVWMLPFFKLGYRKELKLIDIYKPLACDRSETLGNRLEINWKRGRIKGSQSSLLSTIFRTFWKEFLWLSAFNFFNDFLFKLGQPLLLSYLLNYFRKDTKTTYREALTYASGIVCLNIFNAVILNHVQMLAYHLALKARVAVCSVIYRKALRLSQTALGETSSGKMINLLSNDVGRFESALFFCNYLWIAPLFTIIVGYLLYAEIRYAGLIGIGVVFTIMPILSGTLKFTSKYRLKTALKTDERIRLMNEIISGVQVIKMYAWEKPFTKLIVYARKLELKAIRMTSLARGLQMILLLFTSRFALFCTMCAIVLINGAEYITAARIFAISTFFTMTSQLMSQRFSRCIGETAEVLIALKRLQNFLELDEKKLGRIENSIEIQSKEDKSVCISMINVKARWAITKNENSEDKLSEEPLLIEKMLTLNGLNIDFKRGKLIGIIGPVGCGKSSLLQAVLRELPLESGSISIDGTISYASQEPWIFAASIRQNILFGLEYDRDRYYAVVKFCALQTDFEQFEGGDLTLIGERGASISGGQKARINLARACYRDADIYLLDDPLSAVDAHVGTHIFDKCIGPKGYLAKRTSTRILVTHQVHFLKNADWLIVMKNGKVEMQGPPNDLFKNHIEFADLIGIVDTPEIEGNSDKVCRKISKHSLIHSLSSSSSLDSKESNNVLDICDDGIRMEDSSKGKVKGSIWLNYFTAGIHWSALFVLLFSFVLAQTLASASDYWVSIWTKQEETRSNHEQVTSSFSLSTNTCICIQASLLLGLLFVLIARTIGFYSICLRISQNIHNSMFKGIICTTMKFFDTNPSGRILNRFSKDLGSVDENLPKLLLDAKQTILSTLGSIIVAIIVNPFVIGPLLVLSILFMLFRMIYLKTSRNLKRLEGIAKSPIFTHLGATLNGLSTIRAYDKQKKLQKEFDNFQDIHSSCWYMLFTTTTAFGMSIDFLCAIFVSFIVFYYMLFETGTSGEKIGLAISQALSLTAYLSFGARQSAEASNQMMSVERVLEYRDLPPESEPKNPIAVTEEWPTKGCIEFRNVFYRYFAEGEPVLRCLSFVVRPMEKIGIVGRTGAGKSSLIGSLFRLACVEGEILIDDIDTANVELNELRKRIAIIPQDPVLFSGTLRRNLDPFEEYSDAEIWNALESVELKKAVSDAFGLQSAVLPHGANYSVGQRQLLCLARAILRKNRILVLDEATANVDPQTDLLIQRTIRTKFIDCTVLTVAHRLNTIIDSDRVIAMDSGRIVEFDKPSNLLQNNGGLFYGMVKALGEHEFNRLFQLALGNSSA